MTTLCEFLEENTSCDYCGEPMGSNLSLIESRVVSYGDAFDQQMMEDISPGGRFYHSDIDRSHFSFFHYFFTGIRNYFSETHQNRDPNCRIYRTHQL